VEESMRDHNTAQIEIPRLYRNVVPLGLFDISIKHAPLNARIKETLLADVISEISNSNYEEIHILLLAQNVNRIRTLFMSWLPALGLTAKLKSKGFIFPSGSMLWIMNPREINPDDLPFLKLKRCVICDAHSIQEQVFNELSDISDLLVCAGHQTVRDHWFYRFSKNVECYQFTADQICAQFEDQWERVKELSQDYSRDERRRYFNLEDIIISHLNFNRFAESRLWIKTDRKITALHPKQQEYAQDTDGTPIVPYYLTPLNKRYLAMKRMAVKQGKKQRFLLLKYRRGGFTTLEQGLSYHQCVEFSYSQCITLAHTHNSTKRIFRIAKLYHERDPRHPGLISD